MLGDSKKSNKVVGGTLDPHLKKQNILVKKTFEIEFIKNKFLY